MFWQIVRLKKQRRGALWKQVLSSKQIDLERLPLKEDVIKILNKLKVEEGVYALQVTRGGKGHGFNTMWRIYFKPLHN